MVLVLSDIEMGSGGEKDDFPHSAFLGDLLLTYLEGSTGEKPIDFVFNGDTFDLLKTPYLDSYPHHITRDISVAKMTTIAAAHPKFFEALSRILDHNSKNKTIHFIVGNHDTELQFPKVQRFIQALCGNEYLIRFHGHQWQIGPLHIEHGSQSDPMFRFEHDRPFIDLEGKQILNLPWATVMLLDLVMPLHSLLYFHHRIIPASQIAELVPQIKELLTALAWRYWTRDFWREFISLEDPLLKFNWTMAKEIIKRFSTSDPNVHVDKDRLKRSVEKSSQSLFVMGHLHKSGQLHFGEKRIIQTGCFRDEYYVSDDGRTFTPALKNYLEVYLKDDKVVATTQREIMGPPRARESIPDSLLDIAPEVEAHLQNLGDQSKNKSNQREQEKKEADESGFPDKG